MRWGMFGTKRRESLLKKGLFQLFRSSRASRNSAIDVYSNTATRGGLGAAATFNSHAYMLSGKRMREVEAEKAVMVNVSRHPRWAAGGPH